MIKLTSFIFLFPFIFSAHLASAQTLRQTPVVIQGVDILTWPENLTAPQVLSIETELMRGDAKANLLLNQVIEKLNQHGIQSLQNVFHYCENQSVSAGATAFFSQGAEIVAARLSLPGLPLTAWPETAQRLLAQAFSSKVVKTPFLEFLIVTGEPAICVNRMDQLAKAYGALTHEMTHFLLIDPFIEYEDLLSSEPSVDFVKKAIHRPGGELDAFKMGDSATIRLYEKYGLGEISSGSRRFYNSEGQLVNEAGLRSYLTLIYSKFYQDTHGVEEFKNAKADMTDMKLRLLKENVMPAVKQLGRTDLRVQVADEIKKLEALRSDR